MRPLVLAALALAACAGRPVAPTLPAAPATAPATEPAPATTPVYTFEPLRIDVVVASPTGEARMYDARSLLEDGNEALAVGHFDDALAAYDHLLVDFPDSRLVPAALHNAGLAEEGKGDYGRAVERYRRLLAAAPPATTDHRDGLFRIGVAQAVLGQFAESVRSFEAALGRDDLSVENRLEALARLGYGLVELADVSGAEEVLRQGLAYHKSAEVSDRAGATYFAAMSQFYLGELVRRQFLAIRLREPEEQLRADLEEKSGRFIAARHRFLATIRLGNPYWATAAVYQMGVMYRQFWDDWMGIPVPSQLTSAEAAEYVKEVNTTKDLLALLEKSLVYHTRNAQLAGNGFVTEWTAASRGEGEAVRTLLAGIRQGAYITPSLTWTRTAGLQPGSYGARHSLPGEYIPPRAEL